MPKKSYDCPRCHSDNTASYEMIYSGGTQSGSFLASSYGFETGFVGTSGSTSSQSLLAQQTTPPLMPAKDYFVVKLIIFSLTFLVITLSTAHLLAAVGVYSLPLAMFLGFLAALASISLVAKRVSAKEAAEKRIWQQQIAQWQNSWMCLRCGNRWYLM